MEFHNAVLLLGGNQGDRLQCLKNALRQIEILAGRVKLRSTIYETAPWGNKDQDLFLNMAISIETTLSPLDLLEVLQGIEDGMGRERTVNWGPRYMDIDILFYDDHIIDIPELTIPHPRLQERNFVLVPLSAICPDFVHPVFNRRVGELLKDCRDDLIVYAYSEKL